MRGVAAGSFARRRPDLPRGTILVTARRRVLPQRRCEPRSARSTPDEIVAQRHRVAEEIGDDERVARITYEILAHAWRRRDALLVDLKIEFGRLASGEGKGTARHRRRDRQRLVAHVAAGPRRARCSTSSSIAISRPSRRPTRRRSRTNYEQVAEMVGTFPQMRPGMVALLIDGRSTSRAPTSSAARSAHSVCRPCGTSFRSRGRPATCCSSSAQLEATFARHGRRRHRPGDSALAADRSTTPRRAR